MIQQPLNERRCLPLSKSIFRKVARPPLREAPVHKKTPVRLQWSRMKSSVIASDGGCTLTFTVQPSGSTDFVEAETIESEPVASEESSISVPLHPLGVKPSGNQYAGTRNARHLAGLFRILPDELLASFLEFLASQELRLLGSSCKFLYAFCKTEDLWKALLIG